MTLFVSQHEDCRLELTTARNFVRLSCNEHGQLGVYSMFSHRTMYDAMKVARKDGCSHTGVDNLSWLMVD